MSFKIGINRYKSEVGEDYSTERQLFSLFIKLAATSNELCDLELCVIWSEMMKRVIKKTKQRKGKARGKYVCIY